jgi:hypothetical protein
MNAQPIPVAGNAPHRGPKNVYVNQARDVIAPNGQQQFPYPDGTVVVKEAIHDEGFVELIAIMRKVGGDWEYVEHIRRGPDEAFGGPITGVCAGCHSGAAATDFVFTRLE